MSDQTVEFQAKLYVYDLMSCAREFGFKADEDWEVSMASLQEKTFLEKKFSPMLSTRVIPEKLPEMLRSVKFKLNQQITGAENNPDANSVRQQELQYLVAYSLKRLRR